jgi:hypothetical protein
MSGQMSLLAPPAAGQLEVPVCDAVLDGGANARADGGRGEPLFAHRHVPPLPPKLCDESKWLLALDFAEEARRYDQAPRAKLDLGKRGSAGSDDGPMGLWDLGKAALKASRRESEAAARPGKRPAAWPRLLAARSEQREVEPALARARDLAEAYRYLNCYGGAYPEPEPGDAWSPVPLVRRLAAEVRELGGDPGLVELRSDYMWEALST